MSKYLLLITFSLIFSFGVNSSESTRKNYALNVIPMATPPVQGETDKLILDKNTVCAPCPPGAKPLPRLSCEHDMAIMVSASKSINDKDVFSYTISGGRIVGGGAKVVWDLTGAQPGTYQIRVDIESKSKGQKRTESATVTVLDGGCVWDCFCPTLTIDAPKSPVEIGETIIFSASVSGGSGEEITYNWTISDGKIIEGQGTPVIKVSTNSKMAGKIVKATIEIGGVCEECPKTESASSSIVRAKRVKK